MKKNKNLKFEDIPIKDLTWDNVKNEMDNRTNEKDKIYFLKKIKVECNVTRINNEKNKILQGKLLNIEKSADVYIYFHEDTLKSSLKGSNNKHTHGDYIVWLVGLDKLKLFVKLLIENKLISDVEKSDTLYLIEEHFECADVNNSDPKKAKKIHWGKKIPLLAYLINELLNENKFIHKCSHPFALFALHFINLEGNPIDYKDLNDAKNKTKNSTTKRPQNADIVDDIIKEVIRLK